MKIRLLKKLRRKHRIVPLRVRGFYTIASAPKSNGVLTYLTASKQNVIEKQRQYILADVHARKTKREN
jgi:hypothetical protein